MKNTDRAMSALSSHWAIQSIGEKSLQRAATIAHVRMVRLAVDGCIQLDFSDHPNDDSLIHRVSLAYEMAAIDGWDAAINPASGDDLLREQFIVGSSQAFEYRRLEPIPKTSELRILHVLNMASLAYCGERWPDLKRWMKENKTAIQVPPLAKSSWDKRLLYRLFDCWIRLFRKEDWNDLDGIRDIIAGLRNDQKQLEPQVLNHDTNAEDKAMALRLVALYHWARATEILAIYMLQGQPAGDVQSYLAQQFDAAYKAADACYDQGLGMLLRWLHAAARQMVSGSLWWVARAINSRVTRFVESVTSARALFELLPPQQVALQEQGLLDIASRAVVVDMPTSGGKTLLAQFRILQTLNQFAADGGWVAYVVPTRALAAQITRNLRRDFEPIGIKVEQLTGAIDIDLFEDALLKKGTNEKAFDVLVATPEKLQLVIRNKKVPRMLHLVVMDEAHNIEDKERGLRIELLLATIKGEFQNQVSFMLLMPYVEKAEILARWLAGDVKSGRTVSLSTTPWKPNERIIGLYHKVKDDSVRGGWKLTYETLVTTPKTIHLKGNHAVGDVRPLDVPMSAANDSIQTAAMATILSGRSKKSTSIAIAQRPDWAWSMARTICESLSEDKNIPEEIKLVKKFLRTEFGDDYSLIGMLDRRVGVHHARLSDEVRALMEWLAEKGLLRVLCATTTIAQGINFPVGSIFLASCFVPSKHSSRLMTPREFWNLAGRAGRVWHDNVGVVGIAAAKSPQNIRKLVSEATGAIVSRIIQMLDELEKAGRLNELSGIIYRSDWEDFRCYIAHLLNEKKDLDAVIGEMDRQLRNTFGFSSLQADSASKSKAEALLNVTKEYVSSIAKNMGIVALADSTGFSYEGVRKAQKGIQELGRKLTPTDWTPSSLFGNAGSLSNLVGIMFNIDQIAEPLKEAGGEGLDHRKLASVARDWVNGKRMDEIAQTYFSNGDSGATKAMDDACRAIYKAIVISGTWGISALSKINIDFNAISEAEQRQINSLPAMMYHGVKTEEAVLMRMNQVPRGIAESLGKSFRIEMGSGWDDANVQDARRYLHDLKNEEWDQHAPKKTRLSGSEYKEIWQILSGETW